MSDRSLDVGRERPTPDANRSKLGLLVLSTRLTFAAVCLLPSIVQGQCPPDFELWGEQDGDHFSDVAAIGDVNADGIVDFVVGAFQAQNGGAGRAFVYSGKDLRLLYSLEGQESHDLFGYPVAGIGDFDGDGQRDFAVSAVYHNSSAGRVYVFSGPDGQLLHVFDGEESQLWFGLDVAGAGDVNSDGFDDILIGSQLFDGPKGNDNCGRFELLSGKDGSIIYSFYGHHAEERLGGTLNGLGDLDGDGVPEFAVGSPKFDPAGENPPRRFGRATIYSGVSGEILYEYTGRGPYDEVGKEVVPITDINQDETPDFAIAFNVGRVAVYSGADGSLLLSLPSNSPDKQLAVVRTVQCAGDINNDGIADILVGAIYDNALGTFTGRSFVYSGADGLALAVYTGLGPGDFFGWSGDSLGDINEDGFDDIMIGASDSGGPGYVHIFLGGPTQHPDIDGNGQVSVSDLLLLLAQWGPCSPVEIDCSADLNLDASVDQCDLDILLANWGWTVNLQ